MSAQILVGDCRAILPTLDAGAAHTCVTSPPYWGLRDYGHAEQLGLEDTPDEYVEKLVAVFREVRRVLRDDGTLWLNLGDTSIGGRNGGVGGASTIGPTRNHGAARAAWQARRGKTHRGGEGLKPKDLAGIPWMVAFALRADGWFLRSDIIWAKPSPMPEPVTDRPTRSHEHVFLLSKSRRYFYDAAAIAEPAIEAKAGNAARKPSEERGTPRRMQSGSVPWSGETRNKRDVWTVAAQPFSGAHFATFPPNLITPCVLAGSPGGGLVLDPFAGAGTAGVVALTLGRRFVGIELNPEYAAMAQQRVDETPPGLGLSCSITEAAE